MDHKDMDRVGTEPPPGVKRFPHISGNVAPLDVAEEAMKVEAERAEIYSVVTDDFTRLGKLWGTILDEHAEYEGGDVPGHVVCLMMAMGKLQRAANPKRYQRDDYVDAINYVRFAERLAPK